MKKTKRKKMRRRNNHHLIAKSRGGSDAMFNLLRLWDYKHEMWHKIFGNHTLPEIIRLLERVYSIKARQQRRRDDSSLQPVQGNYVAIQCQRNN